MPARNQKRLLECREATTATANAPRGSIPGFDGYLGYFGPVVLADGFLQEYPWLPEVVVGIVATALTLLVTWLWRRNDEQSKTLDHRVFDDVAVFPLSRPEKLKVVYEDIEVAEPIVTRVRFLNTGRQVIDESDLLSPLQIQREGGKLLDFNITNESEPGLARISNLILSEDQTETDAIHVKTKTLNPDDAFTVQLIFDGGKTEPVVVSGGRLRGQSRPGAIYPTKAELSEVNVPVWAAVMLAGFGVMLGYFVYFSDKQPHHGWGAALFIGSALALAIGVFNRFRRKNQLLTRLRRTKKVE
jgi:hypothetical protein